MGNTSHLPHHLASGGPWLFRREDRGLLCRLRPVLYQQDKRVELICTRVGPDLEAYSEENGKLHIWLEPQRPTRGPEFLGKVGTWLKKEKPNLPDPDFGAMVNFCTAEIEPTFGAKGSELDVDISWLENQLDKEVLDALYDTWRPPNGYSIRTEPDQACIQGWSYGRKIGWRAAYPDTRSDYYVTPKGQFRWDDYYCIKPACPCGKAGLSFYRTEGPQATVGGFDLELRSGKIGSFNGTAVSNNFLKALWARIQRRYRTLDVFRQREKHLQHAVGRNLLHLEPNTHGRPSPLKEEAKVPRNAPCPCGSRKKFKRCCGRT